MMGKGQSNCKEDNTENQTNDKETEIKNKLRAQGYVSPPEDEPSIIEYKQETIETDKVLTYYKFTNNKTFDESIAIYCTNFVSNTIREKLLFHINELEDKNFDFRYPMKDQILIGKLGGGRAPWTCEHCLHQNPRVWCFGIDHKCEKCDVSWGNIYDMNDRERMKYLIEQYTDNYNYINHEQQYKKWKICIQSIIDPLLNNKNKYWIPNTIHVDKVYNVSFISEINNLSHHKYPELYNILCVILKSMIKMFEWVLKTKLISKQLDIILSIQNYKLMPNQTYFGTLHCEGFKEEGIVCVGVYYLDKSPFLTMDEFQIAMNLFGICGVPKSLTTKNVNIDNNSCMVFSNKNLVHKLNKLKNGSDTKYAQRKILTVFLIDPDSVKINKKEDIEEKEKKEIRMFTRITRTDEIKRIKLNTTKDIVVNMTDKLEIVIINWYKNNNISMPNDIIQLIINYIEETMIHKRQQRDKLRVQRMVPQKSGVHLPWFVRIN